MIMCSEGASLICHFFNEIADAPFRSLSVVNFKQWKVICQDSTLHFGTVEYGFG
jgi:hypothetical protein